VGTKHDCVHQEKKSERNLVSSWGYIITYQVNYHDKKKKGVMLFDFLRDYLFHTIILYKGGTIYKDKCIDYIVF